MMKTWIEKNKNLIIVLLLLLILGFVGIADVIDSLTPENKIIAVAELALRKVLDRYIEPLEAQVKELSKQIEVLNTRAYQDVLSGIQTQGIKIDLGSKNIYTSDLETLLERWEWIPDNLKTPKYKRIIKQMMELYNNKGGMNG